MTPLQSFSLESATHLYVLLSTHHSFRLLLPLPTSRTQEKSPSPLKYPRTKARNSSSSFSFHIALSNSLPLASLEPPFSLQTSQTPLQYFHLTLKSRASSSPIHFHTALKATSFSSSSSPSPSDRPLARTPTLSFTPCEEQSEERSEERSDDDRMVATSQVSHKRVVNELMPCSQRCLPFRPFSPRPRRRPRT